MAKIPLDLDVVYGKVPSAESGDNPFDNPGITPSEKDIKDTPGESESNDTSAMEVNKAQPYKSKGSGYCGNC